LRRGKSKGESPISRKRNHFADLKEGPNLETQHPLRFQKSLRASEGGKRRARRNKLERAWLSTVSDRHFRGKEFVVRGVTKTLGKGKPAEEKVSAFSRKICPSGKNKGGGHGKRKRLHPEISASKGGEKISQSLPNQQRKKPDGGKREIRKKKRKKGELDWSRERPYSNYLIRKEEKKSIEGGKPLKFIVRL